MIRFQIWFGQLKWSSSYTLCGNLIFSICIQPGDQPNVRWRNVLHFRTRQESVYCSYSLDGWGWYAGWVLYLWPSFEVRKRHTHVPPMSYECTVLRAENSTCTSAITVLLYRTSAHQGGACALYGGLLNVVEKPRVGFWRSCMFRCQLRYCMLWHLFTSTRSTIPSKSTACCSVSPWSGERIVDQERLVRASTTTHLGNEQPKGGDTWETT